MKSPSTRAMNISLSFTILIKAKLYGSAKTDNTQPFWILSHGSVWTDFNNWRLSVVTFKVAKMLKRYWYGVISYVKKPITNATSEGINSKIRVYTKRAFGFRTFEMFRNIVFLGCGGLNIDPFKSS
jgi:hypothetical protein